MRSAFVVLWTLLGMCVGGATVGLLLYPPAPTPKQTAVPPAVMVKEDQLIKIVLTLAAERSLAMQFAKIERKAMPRTRLYGGEVIVPPGQTVIVSAPLSGTLKSAADVPQPGQAVKKGQTIFQLAPLLTPEGRVNLTASKIEADGQVKSSQSQLDAAQVAFERAKRLLQGEAGSQKAFDEAKAQLDLATKNIETSIARRDAMNKMVGDLEKGTTAPLELTAPESGLLRNVSASSGQTVPAGAVLFEVMNRDRVWVRVPTYVGDLGDLDLKADAIAAPLTARAGDAGQSVKPIAAPPAANQNAGTVDLFYELDNRALRFSPGHRVAVRIEMAPTEKEEPLVIPWSAVIHDINGGTWVYEARGERTFIRRRVEVRFVSGDTAVLRTGPDVGTQIVIAGAIELFGTETGFTK